MAKKRAYRYCCSRRGVAVRADAGVQGPLLLASPHGRGQPFLPGLLPASLMPVPLAPLVLLCDPSYLQAQAPVSQSSPTRHGQLRVRCDAHLALDYSPPSFAASFEIPIGLLSPCLHCRSTYSCSHLVFSTSIFHHLVDLFCSAAPQQSRRLFSEFRQHEANLLTHSLIPCLREPRAPVQLNLHRT